MSEVDNKSKKNSTRGRKKDENKKEENKKENKKESKKESKKEEDKKEEDKKEEPQKDENKKEEDKKEEPQKDENKKEEEEERELTPEEIKEKIKHKIGYLIIQEFPISNISYVIGYKPYGKIWFNYGEVMEQYIGLIEDWQNDFYNGEIKNSKPPRVVKIFIMDDENVSGSDPDFVYETSDTESVVSETVNEDNNEGNEK